MRRDRMTMLDSWELPKWPPVLAYAPGSPALATIYENNKSALLLYTQNTPLEEIQEQTTLKPLQVRRLAVRAASRHPLTRMRYGWSACVPGFRVHVGAIPPDEEPPAEEGGTGSEALQRADCSYRAGDFRKFLNEHPRVHQALLDAILKGELGRPQKVTDPTVTDIHSAFTRACRKAGIKDDEYPLCTKNQAFESLRRYRESVLKSDPKGAALVLGGKEMAGVLTNTSARAESKHLTPRCLPMERIEHDAWTVDALFSGLKDVAPEFAKLIAELRPNIVANVDRETGAVCAYQAFFQDAAAAQSRLFISTLVPHVRRRIRAWDYPAGPCFPNEIPELAWCLPREMAMDRVPYQTQLRMDPACKTLGIIPDYPERKQPIQHAAIEGLFGRLTQVVRHWPIATGNHPTSTFRREPEQQAHHFCISALNDFLECFFATYNTMQQADGTSRIEKLQAAVADGSAFIKPMREELRPLVPQLLAPAFSVSINHPPTVGPYVECQYARYFGEDEASRKTLLAVSAREALQLRLHILDDASRGVLCEVRGGVEVILCYLKVLNRRWGRPHSLLERQTLMKVRTTNRTRVLSATTVGGLLLDILRDEGAQAAGFTNNAELSRRVMELAVSEAVYQVDPLDADEADEVPEKAVQTPTTTATVEAEAPKMPPPPPPVSAPARPPEPEADDGFGFQGA